MSREFWISQITIKFCRQFPQNVCKVEQCLLLDTKLQSYLTTSLLSYSLTWIWQFDFTVISLGCCFKEHWLFWSSAYIYIYIYINISLLIIFFHLWLAVWYTFSALQGPCPAHCISMITLSLLLSSIKSLFIPLIIFSFEYSCSSFNLGRPLHEFSEQTWFSPSNPTQKILFLLIK